LAQFTLEMCVADRNRENSLKPPILGVQDHSRSSMLTFLRSSSSVLVMISSMSVPICNHCYARQANSGKITSFQGVAPLSFFRSGDPLAQRHEILSQNTRHSKLSYGENPKYLFHLDLERYRDVSDKRHQDRITIARQNYHSLYAL